MSRLFLISPNKSEAGTLETLPKTEGMILLKNDDVSSPDFEFQEDDKICITSEASLDVVKEKIEDNSKRRAIDLLKDKYEFRKILQNIYPDYVFEKVEFDEITTLNINKTVVLKPSKGCFGTAVKIIDEHSDLSLISQEIQEEITRNASMFSQSVLSQNEFILEDFIVGEEYAVDLYYDHNGTPHIMNIYHHPMPRVDAYLHMIYYSSKEVFDQIYDKAIAFFRKLNKVLNVKNFVMHSEFKYDTELYPIEINSMRIGGMGLGNMVYHALGVNPYACIKTGTSPDWGSIWSKNEEAIYAFFIAYNGKSVDQEIYEPNIEKLRKQFTHILREEIFDYQSQLAFGIFCLKESNENLKKLLTIDFDEYFKPISKN